MLGRRLKSPVDASSGALTLQPLQVASIWPAMARWTSAWIGLLVDGPHYHVSSPRRRRVAHAKESTLLEGGSKQGQAPPADFVVGQKSGPLRSGVWLAWPWMLRLLRAIREVVVDDN